MTITAGTPFQFEASNINAVAIAALSSTKSIVLYEINGGNLEARIIQSDETVGAAFVVDAAPPGSGFLAIAGLSSTAAVAMWEDGAGSALVEVLSVAGTTITAPGASVDVSGGAGGINDLAIASLSSTAAVTTFTTSGGSGQANYITISGTTITDRSNVAYNGGNEPLDSTLVKLSITKAVAAYFDNDDSTGEAVVLSIAGFTISAGTPVVFDVNAVTSPELAEISSSQCLLSYDDNIDSKTEAVVLSIAGTVITVNTPADVDADFSDPQLAGFGATAFFVASPDSISSDGQMREVTVSGTSVSAGATVQFTANTVKAIDAVTFSGTLGVIVYEDGSDSDIGKAVIVTLATSLTQMTIAPMTKPADVDADGLFLYVAGINLSGFPVLIKIASSLAADGTLVFNPGAGDNIGVQCGRSDATVIWVGGKFDGTNKLEKSEDSGDSFAVKDDGTFADIEAFVVGPDSDDRVLVADETIEVQETIDSGATWTQRNAATGFNVNAIARLGKNVQESVFGNDASANDNINYSVNAGSDMEDYTTGSFPTDSDASSVIVN